MRERYSSCPYIRCFSFLLCDEHWLLPDALEVVIAKGNFFMHFQLTAEGVRILILPDQLFIPLKALVKARVHSLSKLLSISGFRWLVRLELVLSGIQEITEALGIGFFHGLLSQIFLGLGIPWLASAAFLA